MFFFFFTFSWQNDPNLAQIVQEIQLGVVPTNQEDDELDAGTMAESGEAEVTSSQTSDTSNSSIAQDIPGGHDDLGDATCNSAEDICSKVSFVKKFMSSKIKQPTDKQGSDLLFS